MTKETTDPTMIIIKSSIDNPEGINVGKSFTLSMDAFRRASQGDAVVVTTLPIGYLGAYQIEEGLMFTDGEVSTIVAELCGPVLEIHTAKGLMMLDVETIPEL